MPHDFIARSGSGRTAFNYTTGLRVPRPVYEQDDDDDVGVPVTNFVVPGRVVAVIFIVIGIVVAGAAAIL